MNHLTPESEQREYVERCKKATDELRNDRPHYKPTRNAPQPIHRIELCDAGMGETEYRIFEGDRFICQCPDNPTAWEVIHALQRPHTPATAENLFSETTLDRVRKAAREQVLTAIDDCATTDGEWIRFDDTDFLYLNYTVLSKKIESLRGGGAP